MRNRNALRSLLLAAGLTLFSAGLHAQTVVDQGSTHTPRGIGGYRDLSYAFAKGDTVHLKARSNKFLARVVATKYPDGVLARVRSVKRPDIRFVMPEEGVVTFRFVSDRNGEAQIDYTVTRAAGPDGPAEYDTKVKWKEPVNTVGGRIPELRK